MRSLPPWRGIDRAFAAAMFLYDHRRIPRRPPRLYDDLLFWTKLEKLEEPLRIEISDKLRVKDYVRNRLGRDACPETLAVFRRPEEITAEAIPAGAIVKPTHMSGRVLRADGPLTEAELEWVRGWLSESHYYRYSRERNYLHLEPGIVCERPVAPPERMADYKILCLDGEPRVTSVYYDRWTGKKRFAFFDRDWRVLADDGRPPPAWIADPHPLHGAMYEVAAQLSAPFDFIRVDVYLASGEVLVGELTNTPEGARAALPRAGEEAVSRALFAAAV